MGKKSRRRMDTPTPALVEDGTPSPRQPCPCGSGRRYKACHGSATAPPTFVARPFADLPGECDLVALREFVPSASMSLTTERGEVLAASLLPGAASALRRDDGSVWLGMQVRYAFTDPSRDLAAAVEAAWEAEVGPVNLTTDPGPGARLQDLVTGAGSVSVYEGFDWWMADAASDPGLQSALDQANEMVLPTARLASVAAAYWADVRSKEYLRWVMPYDEEPLLDALARLHVAGQDRLVEGSRLVGMFRAHGLLVPVWDLATGTGPEALEDPVVAFERALSDALASGAELTPAERSARSGLANRQVTLR